MGEFSTEGLLRASLATEHFWCSADHQSPLGDAKRERGSLQKVCSVCKSVSMEQHGRMQWYHRDESWSSPREATRKRRVLEVNSGLLSDILAWCFSPRLKHDQRP